VAIDGGSDYYKVSTGTDFVGEHVKITTKLSERELYDDWNRRHDRWGLHEGKISKIGHTIYSGTQEIANDPVDW